MSIKQFYNPLSDKEYQRRLFKRYEDIRGPYFRDQTAIIHSLPFRRLKHKTQVFFSPKNDHVCTRIEHSLHVATIASTIAKGLGLNQELAYAIGLGHDLGHAPFGHAGEMALQKLTKEIGGFLHEANCLRVVDKLGNRGKSLNLTYGVRDGIRCHCGESIDQSLKPRNTRIDLYTIRGKDMLPSSFEGCIARMSDRIAYLGRDLEDAIYGDFIRRNDIPSGVRKLLGYTNGEIIDTLVIDVITASQSTGEISMSYEKCDVLRQLHEFSINRVYGHIRLRKYQEFTGLIIERLFDRLIRLYTNWGLNYKSYENSQIDLDRQFGRYLNYMCKLYQKENASAMQIACDYVSGMTDDFALKCIKDITIPVELEFGKNK